MADFKYILFSHLPKPADNFARLESEAGKIATCLSLQHYNGVLVLFIDCGWHSLLNTIGRDFDPQKMAEEFQEIKQFEDRAKAIKKKHPTLHDRLRLVTAKTLNPILNNLRGGKPGLEATRLKKFLVGAGLRYDTTKVVEALIRIRHLGSGVPVLRVDWDALLCDRTLNSHLLETMAERVAQFSERLAANHRVHSYVVSGLYEQPTEMNYRSWKVNDFNTAFATRLFPALIPSEKAITMLDKKTVKVERRDTNGTMEQVVEDCGFASDQSFGEIVGHLYDAEVMVRYYGLEEPQAGLPALGSHPLRSVVSGAGMVINEGAILDLPPFSNFQQNVMWIDDYLKYEMHRVSTTSRPSTSPVSSRVAGKECLAVILLPKSIRTAYLQARGTSDRIHLAATYQRSFGGC